MKKKLKTLSQGLLLLSMFIACGEPTNGMTTIHFLLTVLMLVSAFTLCKCLGGFTYEENSHD